MTSSHLRHHQTTITLYKAKFPEAMIVDPTISKAISSKLVGRVRSQEHKDNLSCSISLQYKNGRTANKCKQGKPDSEETRNRKRLARLGSKHTEETKAKIGKAHKGKVQPPDAVARQKITMKASIEANGGGFAVGPRSQEFKDKMSGIALARPESEWRPKMEAAWEARRGMRLSPEQCEKHRQATIKWMTDNPTKVFNTKVELAFKAELNSRNIEYVQQFRIENHPYDFFLPEFNTIVEIDGPHHCKGPIWGVSGKSQLEKDEMFQKQIAKDARENMIAGIYGYRIVRLKVGCILDYGPDGDFLDVLKAQGLLL